MSEPPEPIAEEFEAAKVDPLEIGKELETAMGEPREPTAQEWEWYSELQQILFSNDESPPDLRPAAAGLLLDPSATAPGAVVEVTGDVSAVAAGTARAVVEEMVGDGVDLQQEFPPAAPAVATQVVQQHGVAPWVLGTVEAPTHGPQTGDAEMGQRMLLDPAAAAVATQIAQHRVLAPSVVGTEEATQTGDAEMQQMVLDSVAAVATQTVQHDVLAPVQREPYSETTVIHFINQNRWIDLQRYLLSCMPQDGKDLTMEHAHLFLCCRKANLLNILNDAKCDPMEAESYLKSSILPLGAATSKYVNSVQLNREIQSIHDCFYEGRNITNIGAQDSVKDYMDFHFPNQTRYKQGKSVAWRFMSKIEGECSKGRGTVLARCKLCQNRMPAQNSVRSLVVTHIGGQKCPNLTLFAQELYNSIIIGVELKQKMSINDPKRKPLDAVDDSGPGKIQRVDTTPVNLGRTQGGHLLKDINNSIDDVFSSVNDLCLISNPHNKASVKRRIHLILGKIKNSVALLVAQTAASTMAGVAVPPFESNKVTDVAGASISQAVSTPMMPPLLPSSVEIPNLNFDNTASHPAENTTDNLKDSQEDDEEHH